MDSFAGYGALGSAMPSYIQDGLNTSRYTTNPLEVRESSYMGLKNPFENRFKWLYILFYFKWKIFDN